ncbi:response regulator [Thermomonas sp.]|uniref:response regulator n=1 Tax=Thermomonas sp. TaxID=1971895 RepID=UPI0025EF5FAC|nr:response regulator [Thermomonas sp.]
MERFDPDLVLMDLHMPGTSGTVLTLQIREHPRFAQVPVVFLTGDQDPERQMEVLENGGDDYILGPVRPRHLIAAVQSRVRRARALQSRIASTAQPERHPVTGSVHAPGADAELAALLPERAGGAMLVEVGNTTALRNRYGYAGFEKLTNDAGRHLGEIARTHAVARLSDNAFLGWWCASRPPRSRARMRALRDGIGYHDFSVGDESLRLRSTVGIADLGIGFADAGAVLAAAEDAAREARAGGGRGQLRGTAGATRRRDHRHGPAGARQRRPAAGVPAGGRGCRRRPAQFQVLLRVRDAQGIERMAGEFSAAAESAGLGCRSSTAG